MESIRYDNFGSFRATHNFENVEICWRGTSKRCKYIFFNLEASNIQDFFTLSLRPSILWCSRQLPKLYMGGFKQLTIKVVMTRKKLKNHTPYVPVTSCVSLSFPPYRAWCGCSFVQLPWSAKRDEEAHSVRARHTWWPTSFKETHASYWTILTEHLWVSQCLCFG